MPSSRTKRYCSTFIIHICVFPANYNLGLFKQEKIEIELRGHYMVNHIFPLCSCSAVNSAVRAVLSQANGVNSQAQGVNSLAQGVK